MHLTATRLMADLPCSSQSNISNLLLNEATVVTLDSQLEHETSVLFLKIDVEVFFVCVHVRACVRACMCASTNASPPCVPTRAFACARDCLSAGNTCFTIELSLAEA